MALPPLLTKRLAAETLGTALLLATVVGAGIMAGRLAGGNVAVALLANAIATGAMLFVLITMFGPVSGAHFNPAVTAVMAARRELPAGGAVLYILVQVGGAVLGVWLAHAMFDLTIVQQGVKLRSGVGQWISEGVATFGLILTFFGTRNMAHAVAPSVALYITAAYWFTASTSFANPAVTIARAMTDSFAGIAPVDARMFVLSQLAGAIGAAIVGAWLFSPPRR